MVVFVEIVFYLNIILVCEEFFCEIFISILLNNYL